MTSPIPAFEAAGRTDLGRHLEPDHDAFVIRRDLGLYALADGVAEFPAGEIAAAITVAAIEACVAGPETAWPSVLPRSAKAAMDRLTAALQHANTRLFDAGTKDPTLRGMGATVVAVLLAGDTACLVHVGDSRIHRLRDGEIKQLTEDQNLANALVAEGMAPEAVNALVGDIALKHTLGSQPIVWARGRRATIRPGDLLLLTSDAFHAMRPEDLAASLTGEDDLSVTLDRVFARATERGGPANRTAILLRWPA